jgi:tRNA threonylcarbamoyl adenosine modification protein YeaZ
MNILGIDTTTKSASCTILKENEYYTKEVTNEITHSEKLLPIIHETLKENNLTLDNIDMFATINGPGSFTGIRIGLATIKAFAQVKDIDIFSISSIDLMSYVAAKKELENSNDKKISVLSLIDARNNRVYYRLNKVSLDENGKYEITSSMDVKNDLIDEVSKNNTILSSSSLIICGDCVEKYNEKFEALKIAQKLNFYPTTEDLIDCYLHLKNTKDYMYNAYTLDALYARPSQAERVSNNG